jgi:hypothetical protein
MDSAWRLSNHRAVIANLVSKAADDASEALTDTMPKRKPIVVRMAHPTGFVSLIVSLLAMTIA